MKYNLQEVISADEKSATKILFPEMYSDYIAKTFHNPGNDEVESLMCFIEDTKLNLKFNFTLVGSILDHNVVSNDLDIVLTKKKGTVSIKELEQTLIEIRLFGLQELFCDIDIYFLTISQETLTKKISEKKHFYIWQLNRPNQKYFISVNTIKYKKLGKMIVLERKPELELSHDKTIKLNTHTDSLPKSRLLL
jgi:hypothetical protein